MRFLKPSRYYLLLMVFQDIFMEIECHPLFAFLPSYAESHGSLDRG
jgi:hypothetical protein